MANSHYLADYLRRQNYTGNLNNQFIQSRHIAGAKSALVLDKDSFFINALVSFGSCINSINKSNYSWAFIQSYYSLFFLARAMLAEKSVAIYYPDTKPFSIKFVNGEQFTKLSGTSHDVVLQLFRKSYSSDIMLSNTIEGKDPTVWFKENRELINYKLNPFSDPTPPLDLFHYEENLRKWMLTYLKEISYAFSGDHAYIAYVFKLLIREIDQYINDSRTITGLNADRIKFIKQNFQNGGGPIDFLVKRIEQIMEPAF